MGEEFILGITHLVAREKDPRNLMVIFSFLKVILVEWDITNHVEVKPSGRSKYPMLIAGRFYLMLYSAIFPSHSDLHSTILSRSQLRI